MGYGRLEISRGATIVVPTDFVGNHFENALPVPSQAKHMHSHDMRPCRWRDINTSSGVYDWSGLDARVSAYGSGTWTYCCWGTPTWASARPAEVHPYWNGAGAEPASMSTLAAFVTALVTRYPTLTHIEVWNEPDIPTTEQYYWYSGSASTFVTMAETIKTAAKAVRPGIKIIGPGTVNYLSSPNWLDAVWAAGLDAHLDAVSLHAYQMQWHTPLKAFLGLAHSRQYMLNSRSKAALPAKDIYVSEFGQINPVARNMTEAEIITGYRRAMVAAAALGYKHACWYHYDGPSFGYTGRQAIVDAVAEMCSLLPGSTLTDVYLKLPEQTVCATINGVPYEW